MDDVANMVKSKIKIKISLAIATATGGCFLPLIIFVALISCLVALGLFDTDTSGATASSSSGECGFTISTTSLSKEEYKSKLEAYASSKSQAEIFAKNADNIYDLAQSANINPELVIVRADVEGYSPGGSTNNYWGIGCTNNGGLKACKSYGSFLKGVDAYIKNISKYSSLKDMMSQYAYIGDYWYNPGSSSKGGCYYYKYIKDYYDTTEEAQKSKARAAKACSSGKSNVKTNDDDQDAYANWQVNANMGDSRKRIFGLEDENTTCTNSTNDDTSNVNLSNIKTTEKISDKFTGDSFNSFLKSKGSSQESFNKQIYSSVKTAGLGTRNGVAAAGLTMLSNMANYGYKFKYTYGGKYSNYGVPDSIGKSGLDCSGFVSWAIHNGGFAYNYKTSGNWKTVGSNCKRTSNNCVGKAGDLIYHKGHIMLIAGVDGDYYYVAEAANSKDGMKLTKQSIHKNSNSKKTDYIVDMTNYYKNTKKVSNYPS